jgi:hypothetical protein
MDAQCINPEPIYVETQHHKNRFLEGLWQVRPLNVQLEGFQRGFEQLHRKSITPAMAKGCVLQGFRAYLRSIDKFDLRMQLTICEFQ